MSPHAQGDGFRKGSTHPTGWCAVRRPSQEGSTMTVISVIIGSTRQKRFAEKPARWVLGHLQERSGIEARLLDLKDFPMPFFDQAVVPAATNRAPYEHEAVQRWTAEIARADGFVF